MIASYQLIKNPNWLSQWHRIGSWVLIQKIDSLKSNVDLLTRRLFSVSGLDQIDSKNDIRQPKPSITRQGNFEFLFPNQKRKHFQNQTATNLISK